MRSQYNEEESDLYSFSHQGELDFESFEQATGLLGQTNPFLSRPAPTSFILPSQSSNTLIPPTGGSNPWLTAGSSSLLNEDTQRPMTSVVPAGYSSNNNNKRLSTLSENLGGKTQAAQLHKKSENSNEDMAIEMEREVSAILEDVALLLQKDDTTVALEKAKLAQKKERTLIRFREEKNVGEQNMDITYSVAFSLARAFHSNMMYTEALDTYTAIAKNKHFQNAGRLRVNMGNIYFEQKKYNYAIKMYRMALDQIMPANHNELRNKILINIGISFLKLGQYSDAAQNFEQIVENANNCAQTAFNLLLCYFALGEKKNMRKAFKKLLNVLIPGMEFDDDLDDETYALMNDELREHLKEKQKLHWDFILKGAKLIAEVLEDDWEKGYDYVIGELKSFALKKEKCNLVGEMEMAKALNYLKYKKFSKAIESLKAFEKKDMNLQARASTNLAYLYLLEGDIKNAQRYATLSVEFDKYNSKALVNLGNCAFFNKDLQNAKSLYRDAITAEPDCIEAIYNLGLICKELKEYEEAIVAFKKLHTLIPEAIDVIYQIANIFAKLEENSNAIDWYNRLLTRVPTDPTVLYNLGTLYAKESDETQAYNMYLESYRYYPVIMEAISWLGLYFVKNEIYEKALQYFERTTLIQPKEIEWQLMVASCHRRIGAYLQAKRCYEEIHIGYPENTECLKYLVQLCGELGLKKEKKVFSKKLTKVEENLKRQQNKKADELQPEDDDPLDKDDSVTRFQHEQVGKIVKQEVPVEQEKEVAEEQQKVLQEQPQRIIVNDKRIERDDEEILGQIDNSFINQLYSS